MRVKVHTPAQGTGTTSHEEEKQGLQGWGLCSKSGRDLEMTPRVLASLEECQGFSNPGFAILWAWRQTGGILSRGGQ